MLPGQRSSQPQWALMYCYRLQSTASQNKKSTQCNRWGLNLQLLACQHTTLTTQLGPTPYMLKKKNTDKMYFNTLPSLTTGFKLVSSLSNYIYLFFIYFQGEIHWCDDHMAQLCGYLGPHQVCGLHMRHIIPSFLCPDPVRGLTKVGLMYSKQQSHIQSESLLIALWY
jgi:hypothetical protein